MKVTIAQINPTIADIEGNLNKILSAIDKAKLENSDLIIFPEMAIIGYPPMDLLENKKLIDDNIKALEVIARDTNEIAVICAYVEKDKNNPSWIYNAAAFIKNGKIVSKHFKTHLPEYDVFDEERYFRSASEYTIAELLGKKIGITICEDIWDENKYTENRKNKINPVKIYKDMGADIIVNISASPYIKDKNIIKRKMISSIAKKNNIDIIYVNQIGGNDSLIFDGNSFVVNKNGKIIFSALSFEEDIASYEDNKEYKTIPENNELENIKKALELGVRDYVRKCGFESVVIGLSGGIDSALTAAIAAEALGPENVTGVTMPSIYSSKGSIEDSIALGINLGIKVDTIPIKQIVKQFNEDLTNIFKGMKEDITEENIQARIRGTILMAISNKTGKMLLSTGNKSELAMGYCTLYGDMSGGLAVISDLPKTLVYKLSRYINKDRDIIPYNTIEKAPSAELKENQKDEDSLPPYEILDKILELYIEEKNSAEEIINKGFDKKIVKWILKTVNMNEYKRRQAAPGLKITSKAFGTGRRMPLAQKYIP